ncbi:hypothetical protein [Streptomyces sp. NPDC005078]|uniref:hypothetical protein n=1 Tax=unclassified Streptomyces TaxID=2593676 RepID=UPI0033BF3D21
MPDPLDAIEERIHDLQQAMRRARAERNDSVLKELRAELRRSQRAWETLFAQPDDSQDDAEPGTGPLAVQEQTEPEVLLPAREQVHQVLSLLNVPAAPKLISSVHEAFFASPLPPSRLTSLRRDEERSYRSAPNARPYYLCPALTSDLLSPARGLLTISIWPMEQRIVGPLSARVHFLTGAIRIVDKAQRLHAGDTHLPAAVDQLLRRYALNIPGAQPSARQRLAHGNTIDLELLHRAAEKELAIHAEADAQVRTAAADRARRQLKDIEQLFGGTFESARHLRPAP